MRQTIIMINSLIGLFLMLIANPSFADMGYIRHRIVNNTPNELYVSVRQQFQYPIEGCLGPIASGATKECEGSFEKGTSVFVVELIKNTHPSEELRATSSSFNTTPYQNLLFTWTIKLDDKQQLGVWLKAGTSAAKWASVTALTQQEK